MALAPDRGARRRRMRILYGVCGEGMGHATRSHVFLDDLVREHEVYVVASGRARGLPGRALPHRETHPRLHPGLRGQRPAALGDGGAEPARRRVALAAAGAQLLRGGARVPARRGGQRLRLVLAAVRPPAAHPGDHGGQHHDARPLRPRRGDRRRRRPELRAGAADSALQVDRGVPLHRTDVLPAAAAQASDDAGGSDAAAQRARRRAGAGRAPARLPDGRRQRDPGAGAQERRHALPPVRRAT